MRQHDESIHFSINNKSFRKKKLEKIKNILGTKLKY
jgi:hypothetical protein